MTLASFKRHLALSSSLRTNELLGS
jgi:hypothetical protein